MTLNPKVQGSIPCASTNLFVQVRLIGLNRPSADGLHLLRLIGNTPCPRGANVNIGGVWRRLASITPRRPPSMGCNRSGH